MNFLCMLVILQKYELNIAVFVIVVLERHTPSEQTVDNFPYNAKSQLWTLSPKNVSAICHIQSQRIGAEHLRNRM